MLIALATYESLPDIGMTSGITLPGGLLLLRLFRFSTPIPGSVVTPVLRNWVNRRMEEQ
jgi:hypothetical protein